jgi:hypothetical protein
LCGLGRNAQFGPDPLPGDPRVSGRFDGIGDLEFTSGTGQGGATEQVLGDTSRGRPLNMVA